MHRENMQLNKPKPHVQFIQIISVKSEFLFSSVTANCRAIFFSKLWIKSRHAFRFESAKRPLYPLISLPWPPHPLGLDSHPFPCSLLPSCRPALPRSAKEEPGSKGRNHGSDFWWLIRSRGWEAATLSPSVLPTLRCCACILSGLS